jgi:hypothetical protein
MKKALITAALGFATVVTSHAQGFIVFDNYDSQPYMPIVWGVASGGHGSGGVADPNVHADLLFTLGTAFSASTDLGLSVPIDPTAIDSFGNAGYFKGGSVTIPGYVSGPVTFQIEAWQTAGPEGGSSYAASGMKGLSAPWTEASLATTGLPVQFFANLPGPDGAPLLALLIPEPSVFALSGVGIAALILHRRRVASKRSEDGRK